MDQITSSEKSKIKIKLGNIELDFEGTEEYIRDDLPQLLDLILKYSGSEILPSDDDESEEEELIPDNNSGSAKIQMTTTSIATKLNVKKGTQLVLAACAHISLVKSVEVFERSNILSEMKTASGYYKETYSKNLTASLTTLMKAGKIIERSQDQYALSAEYKSQVERQLAGN
ncbi:MAG: hypothetical protein ACFB9N_12600 [Geitlerinemataceae cyanobacterium]